mmetsp:Transcript_67639/g.127782  ORF Transcript_67639/g.127782 Transcript_67639/m.127782 type:complete len:100 (+) Transcript_67639:1-300(+)
MSIVALCATSPPSVATRAAEDVDTSHLKVASYGTVRSALGSRASPVLAVFWIAGVAMDFVPSTCEVRLVTMTVMTAIMVGMLYVDAAFGTWKAQREVQG